MTRQSPLSPPCGGRGGGSAASDQIGLEMGSPPSAFGISPARGATGTYSKVSLRGEMSRSDRGGGPPTATR